MISLFLLVPIGAVVYLVGLGFTIEMVDLGKIPAPANPDDKVWIGIFWPVLMPILVPVMLGARIPRRLFRTKPKIRMLGESKDYRSPPTEKNE